MAPDVILSQQPTPFINFFKPILFMASDSSSGFHQGISHFFMATKNTTERVERRTNEQYGLGSTPSTRRGVLWWFCAAFCAFVDYRGHVFCAKLLQKTTRNANSFLTVFPHCLLLLTVHPLDSVVNCSLWVPFSTAPVFSRTFLSSSTSGLEEDLEFKPFVWVSCQNRQRDRLPGKPPT